MLTQEYLKSILNYDPDTGKFTWKIARSGKVPAGKIAGSVGVRGYQIITITVDKKSKHNITSDKSP